MGYTNLETLVAEVRPLLHSYLESHGINTSKNFSCITGKHTDKKPSMTCKKYPNRAYCFGCNTACDIFQAAHYLEGKPLKGSDWIYENVVYLANKFNLEFSLSPPSDRDILIKRIHRAYEAIATFSSEYALTSTNFNEFFSKRQLSPADVTAYSVGMLPLDKVQELLLSLSLEDVLDDAGLNDPLLFSENRVLFSIRDSKGTVCSFVSRATDDSEPRYYHMPTYTPLRNTLNHGSNTLYGEDLLTKTASNVLLVEGHMDALSLWIKGHKDVCAIGSLALRKGQLDRLRDLGKFSITLCPDNDPAGKEFLSQKIANDNNLFLGLNVYVKLLTKSKDADEFLRTHSLDEFQSIECVPWLKFCTITLSREGLQPEDVVKHLLKSIAKESSMVTAFSKAGQLAELTKIPHEAIVSDLKELIRENSCSTEKRVESVIQDTIHLLRTEPDNAESILLNASNRLTKATESVQSENNQHSFIKLLDFNKKLQESKEGFEGFRLDPNGLGNLEDILNGPWRTSKFIGIGGKENVGKTGFCCQLLKEIVTRPENNAIGIHWSIDDPLEDIIPRYVCLSTEGLDMEMNFVSNPSYYSKLLNNEDLLKDREEAFNKIRDLGLQGKLLIRDASNGKTISYLRSLIAEARAKHPNKNIVCIIDNLHNVKDYDHLAATEKMTRVSKDIKEMCVTDKITCICTIEYRKLMKGQIPSNADLADSRALAYDSNVIFHFYNDLHEKGSGEAEILNEASNPPTPRILVRVGKNKVSAFKGDFFLNFYAAQSRMTWVDIEQANKEREERKTRLKSGHFAGPPVRFSYSIPMEREVDETLF